MKIIIIVFIAFLSSLFIIGCNQTIELDLPEYESELVVECYIEPGLPYIVSVTESVSFFDAVYLPVLTNAEVTIEHLGEISTLQLIDSLGVYVNLSVSIEDEDYAPYYLKVVDLNTGRTATGTARLQTKINIDSISYVLNDSLEASIILLFQDIPQEANFFKPYFANSNNILDQDSTRTWEFSDRLFEDGGEISVGMGYNYRVGDEIIVRLYHIEEDYYTFLETVDDAEGASESPFARPSRIIGNIEGGQGIFTAPNFSEVILDIVE